MSSVVNCVENETDESSRAYQVSGFVQTILESDRPVSILIFEAAVDKYLPMFAGLTVALAGGKAVKVLDLDPRLKVKIEETRQTFKREDRIVWALRFFKKALIEELLWLVEYKPLFFNRKAGGSPAKEQPLLQAQLKKLDTVDLTPFQMRDPDDFDAVTPVYKSFYTIDTINQELGEFVKEAEEYGENEPDNIIYRLIFQNQGFHEIFYFFRQGRNALRKKYYSNWEADPIPRKPGWFTDAEGELETLIEFPNDWRWFDLHRKGSKLHGEDTMYHCGNMPTQQYHDTVYELAEPITIANTRVWKPHLTFVLDKRTGKLGQMKGRRNQPPSPRLWKYIFELLRQRLEIEGLLGGGHLPQNNFHLNWLSNQQLKTLVVERPELWANSSPDQLPNQTVIQGRVMPGQPA